MPALIDVEPIRKIITKDHKAAAAVSRPITNSVAKPTVTIVKPTTTPVPTPKYTQTKKHWRRKWKMPHSRGSSKENASPSGGYEDPALRQIDEVVNKELEAARVSATRVFDSL